MDQRYDFDADKKAELTGELILHIGKQQRSGIERDLRSAPRAPYHLASPGVKRPFEFSRR